MFYNLNYTNNQQCTNNNQIINNNNQLNQINMNPYYISNCNNNNNNYYTQYQFNNNNFQPIVKFKKNKTKNKAVKFNENISIVNVPSFKEYNKLDEDDINLNNNNDFNNKKININGKKKGDNCECIII